MQTGGKISTAKSRGQIHGHVQLASDAAGSQIDVHSLTNFQGGSNSYPACSSRPIAAACSMRHRNVGDVEHHDRSHRQLYAHAAQSYTDTGNVTFSSSSFSEQGSLADSGRADDRGNPFGRRHRVHRRRRVLLRRRKFARHHVAPRKYNPTVLVRFDGNGTTANPQLLEAMSADDGSVESGFQNNFNYGTINLTNNTTLKLVDQAHNSGAAGSKKPSMQSP